MEMEMVWRPCQVRITQRYIITFFPQPTIADCKCSGQWQPVVPHQWVQCPQCTSCTSQHPGCWASGVGKRTDDCSLWKQGGELLFSTCCCSGAVFGPRLDNRGERKRARGVSPLWLEPEQLAEESRYGFSQDGPRCSQPPDGWYGGGAGGGWVGPERENTFQCRDLPR